MRKLILQVQLSIDGFIAEPNGATDWLVWKNWDDQWNWDSELKNYFNTIAKSVDCILLSSKMAEGGFIAHWKQAAENPADPRFEYARWVNGTHKVVFTKTLKKSKWENIDVANGDLATEIKSLKKKPGKNIIVYGGAAFVSSLVKEGLIDEFQLFVNPTVLGNGLSIFNGIKAKQNLRLIKANTYDCGIVVQHYEPQKL
jgi:dihydrofolate reductase